MLYEHIYKTVTLKFVNITEQVLDSKFIATVRNEVSRLARNLDNKALRNKEVLFR